MEKTLHATIAEELRNQEILETNDPSKDIVKEVAENENLAKAIDELLEDIDVADVEEKVEAAEGNAIEIDEIQQLDSNEKLGDEIFEALEDYYDITVRIKTIAYRKQIFVSNSCACINTTVPALPSPSCFYL